MRKLVLLGSAAGAGHRRRCAARARLDRRLDRERRREGVQDEPSTTSVKAGKVTFKIKNKGALDHTFVIVKTSLAASKLPVKNDKVTLKPLKDVGPFKPGKGGTLTLTLKPGKYVLYCNIRRTTRPASGGVHRLVGCRRAAPPPEHYTSAMRRYAVAGAATSPALEAFVHSVADQFERDGFQRVESVDDADFVLNMVDGANPKAFRRKSRGTYSASFYELPTCPTTCSRRATRCSCARSRTSCCCGCRARASGSRRWSGARTRSRRTRPRSTSGCRRLRRRSS